MAVMEENFVDFINEVLKQADFCWFVTLMFFKSRFRAPSACRRHWEEIWQISDAKHLERWTKLPATPRECLAQWIKEAQDGGMVSHLCLEERRSDEEVRFHILADLGGCKEEWIQRWKEISGGWAFERNLDDRIAMDWLHGDESRIFAHRRS
jgi:hypothetical protein